MINGRGTTRTIFWEMGATIISRMGSEWINVAFLFVSLILTLIYLSWSKIILDFGE
jgi:hypothetical protein